MLPEYADRYKINDDLIHAANEFSITLDFTGENPISNKSNAIIIMGLKEKLQNGIQDEFINDYKFSKRTCEVFQKLFGWNLKQL